MSGEGVHNVYDDADLLSDISDLSDDVADVQVVVDNIEEDVNAIREVTDAEAILSEVAGQITTDGTEQTVYTEENPAGIFEPRTFKIDFTNQTAAETVVIKVYYRIAVGGNMILQDSVTYTGAQDPDLINIDLQPNRYGIRITIQHTVGETNRAYDWEVFYEEAP